MELALVIHRLHRVASKRSDAGRSMIFDITMMSKACPRWPLFPSEAMLSGEGSYIVLCNVDHPTRDNSPERRVRVGKMHSKASKLKATLVPRDLRQCKVINLGYCVSLKGLQTYAAVDLIRSYNSRPYALYTEVSECLCHDGV